HTRCYRDWSSDVCSSDLVTFTLTDANGIPLAPVLAAPQSDQQVRVRFTIAHVEDYSGGGELGNTFSRYVNDINATQPAYDSKGTDRKSVVQGTEVTRTRR